MGLFRSVGFEGMGACQERVLVALLVPHLDPEPSEERDGGSGADGGGEK
jgi:hypothetical protein